jgi:pimeloyl-ACP methyl ester carboxylesterase
MPTAAVNGAGLYYEVLGTGPTVLLIMGATGDGGHFDRLADLLAAEFTVCTYDRRGNGRSPAPAGWSTTSPEEQADDAAALLNTLGIGPAAVFGTSSGGNFALYMLIRHPEAVRGAILHEPGLYGVLDDFDAVRAPVRAVIAAAMQAGGPAAAVEAFWNYIAGDNAWDRLTPQLRQRLRDTAATLFNIELGTYELSLPDNDTLTAIQIPVRLLVGEQTLPFFTEIATRLAERLSCDVATTPGGHGAYHDHPGELAETIRPFLREFTAGGQQPRS